MRLKEYIDGVSSGNLNYENIVSEYVKKAKDSNEKYNSFIRFHDDYVEKNLSGLSGRFLKAAPIAVKDIILTEGYVTSCASKILEDYIPPYSATCFLNLEKNGGLMIGKANMDEFAMGGSNENSSFGPCINPYGTNRVSGGSSGGSAVAVASNCVIAALGTDTGGSVRQPAAFCGVVGLKPTYGMVSRYGVQAMASSFDQVGVITKTVEDAEILLKAVAGFDPQDSNSDKRADDFVNGDSKNINVKNLKIAVPKDVIGEGLDPKIKERFMETVEKLRKEGIHIDEISLPILSYSLSIYYTLMPAEVSTNMARFDGIRFGLQDKTLDHDSIMHYYEKVKSEGFGDEVKRRILLGTFVLSSANYEGYYLKAQKAREQLVSDMDNVYKNYDIILTPTTPTVAWKVGEKSGDPLQMYLEDLYTVPANIAGLPAMSVPMGTVNDNGEDMSVGIQMMSQRWDEAKLFELGKLIEKL